jgi:hypothetical protein
MTSQLHAGKCHSRLRRWMRVRMYRGHQHGAFSPDAHWRMQWQRMRRPRCSRERTGCGCLHPTRYVHCYKPRLGDFVTPAGGNDIISRVGQSEESSRTVFSVFNSP